MDQDNRDSQVIEKKLSDQFVEFIDLTDEDLEEVEVLEFGGGIHGGQCSGCPACPGCPGYSRRSHGMSNEMTASRLCSAEQPHKSS